VENLQRRLLIGRKPADSRASVASVYILSCQKLSDSEEEMPVASALSLSAHAAGDGRLVTDSVLTHPPPPPPPPPPQGTRCTVCSSTTVHYTFTVTEFDPDTLLLTLSQGSVSPAVS